MKNWIKRHKIISSIIGIILVFSVTISLVSYRLSLEFNKAMIPEEIKLSKLLVSKSFSLPIGGGCGVTIFWLDTANLNEIKQKGIEFFKYATTAKYIDIGDVKFFEESEGKNISYKEWKEITPDYISDGLPAAFGCVDVLDHDWRMKILNAEREGGYYTEYSHWDIIVLPSLGIVILTYFN